MQAKLCPPKQFTFFCRRLKLVRSVLFGPFTSFSGSAGMAFGSCPTKYYYVLQTVPLRTTKYRTIQLYWTVTRTTRNNAYRQRLAWEIVDLIGIGMSIAHALQLGRAFNQFLASNPLHWFRCWELLRTIHDELRLERITGRIPCDTVNKKVDALQGHKEWILYWHTWRTVQIWTGGSSSLIGSIWKIYVNWLSGRRSLQIHTADIIAVWYCKGAWVSWIHPWKLTCQKWRFGRWFPFFKQVIFRFHVNFPGGIPDGPTALLNEIRSTHPCLVKIQNPNSQISTKKIRLQNPNSIIKNSKLQIKFKNKKKTSSKKNQTPKSKRNKIKNPDSKFQIQPHVFCCQKSRGIVHQLLVHNWSPQKIWTNIFCKFISQVSKI